jgi:signal transduction histidine kinase
MRSPSLAAQFLIASLAVLLIGMVIVGAWVGQAIEHGVLNRSAALSALYFETVLGDDLAVLAMRPSFDADEIARFDHLVTDTPFGQRVVAFKIWSPDGEVLYSPDRRLVGQRFELDDGLLAALSGKVSADVSNLTSSENGLEREQWSRLVEIYAPIRAMGPSGRIVGAVEFYQSPEELDAEVASSRLQSWAVLSAVTLAVYLLLAGIVKRGSNTIRRQQRIMRDQEAALRERVAQLSALLDQNARLHTRVRRAADQTTALNEQALRRIGADLHDGPGQTLSLVLLRLDHSQDSESNDGPMVAIQGAVQDALAEIRAIATGLNSPVLAKLSLAEVAERAVRGHQRRSGVPVSLDVDAAAVESGANDAPLSVKIALFRTMEEALSNATRHGGGVDIRAVITCERGGVSLTVADGGTGFNPDIAQGDGHLGLSNMRERAELLGGTFEVQSAPGLGTTVRMWLPLSPGPDQALGPARTSISRTTNSHRAGDFGTH